LFVEHATRGLGLGARLLTEVTRAARERGLHLVLDVLASDEAAVALYDRGGWTRLATVEQWWGPDQRVTVHCYAAPRERAGAGSYV
jgi:ribosomal protein S18 acetylase RimI-like enzyme